MSDWRQWGDEDKVISCGPWSPHAGGVMTKCECCGATLTAFPTSIRLQKEEGWHIICRSCYLIIEKAQVMRPGGNIVTSEDGRGRLVKLD